MRNNFTDNISYVYARIEYSQHVFGATIRSLSETFTCAGRHSAKKLQLSRAKPVSFHLRETSAKIGQSCDQIQRFVFCFFFSVRKTILFHNEKFLVKNRPKEREFTKERERERSRVRDAPLWKKKNCRSSAASATDILWKRVYVYRKYRNNVSNWRASMTSREMHRVVLSSTTFLRRQRDNVSRNTRTRRNEGSWSTLFPVLSHRHERGVRARYTLE